jgi:hypothetical protein
VRPLASVVGDSFLLLVGRGSSSELEGGDGMSSGAGVVLAEERREEDGEGSDRVTGDGERERMESSDSLSEGRSLSGELGPPVNMHDAIAKGRRDVCVFAADVRRRTRLAAATVKPCRGSRDKQAAQLRSQQQRLQTRQHARK